MLRQRLVLAGCLLAAAWLSGCVVDKSPVLPVTAYEVEVGRMPLAFTAGLAPQTLLVSCENDDAVYALASDRRTVAQVLKVRKGPNFLIPDLDHSAIYCLHLRENSISILSGKPLSVVRSLGTGDIGLASGALRPGTSELWICDGISSIYGLVTPGLQLKGRIHLGRYPQHIAFSRDGQYAYVTLKGENAVAQVDLRTELETKRVAVGIYPHDIVLAGNTACVTDTGSDEVSLLDTVEMKETARISVRPKPTSLSLLGATLWVSCEDSYRLVAINVSQARVIGTVKTNFYPGAIKALDDGTLVVADPRGNRVVFLTPAAAPAAR
jgi:DNA-binding beta-propeller fold protein YncE